MPSQAYLKPETVEYILNCLHENREADLPPTPIVRRDEAGNLVAIDGHNLLAVRAFLGQNQEVHVAQSADDGLPETSEPNKLRNTDLRARFDSCLTDRDRAAAAGITSFQDLVKANEELFKEWQ